MLSQGAVNDSILKHLCFVLASLIFAELYQCYFVDINQVFHSTFPQKRLDYGTGPVSL